MKVLIVTEYFPPLIFGGGEISAFNLAKELKENKIEVDVLTSKKFNKKTIENKNGIRIFRLLKTGKNPSSLYENIKRIIFLQHSLKTEIKKIIKKENYDVIHFLNTTTIPSFKIKSKAKKIATFNSYTNFCPKRNLFYKEKTSCSGAKFTKCVNCISNSKFIGKYEMPKYLRYNPLFWIALYLVYKKNNKSLKNIDKYIALSDYSIKILLKNNIAKHKIPKIPNLFDITVKKSEFKIKKNKINISYIGTLEKIKGTELLIKAFTKLNPKNTYLSIFGEGSQKNYLKKISNKNINFYGNIDYKYIPSIYEQSDIIIQSSLWPEPLPRVLFEATYFGKPIISTNSGGNEEFVKDSINGFLIKSQKELEDKMMILINNSQLRNEMGKNSKKIFNNKFKKDIVIKKIIKEYMK